MFTMFFRAIFLYGILILTMRLLGKRQLGEFQPFEFALTILLADIISGPIGSVSTPLLYGVLPVMAVIVVHGVLTIACMKSDKLRAVISGKPTLVISRGVIDRRELNRLCLSLSDLLEGLRGAGFLDPTEVGTAVVEANGTISAFADAQKRPPNTAELQLNPGYEGLPMILIMDGRLQEKNLRTTGKSEAWLTGLLSGRALCAEAVYLAALDTQGRLTLQMRDDTLISFQAMPQQEVTW